MGKVLLKTSQFLSDVQVGLWKARSDARLLFMDTVQQKPNHGYCDRCTVAIRLNQSIGPTTEGKIVATYCFGCDIGEVPS